MISIHSCTQCDNVNKPCVQRIGHEVPASVGVAPPSLNCEYRISQRLGNRLLGALVFFRPSSSAEREPPKNGRGRKVTLRFPGRALPPTKLQDRFLPVVCCRRIIHHGHMLLGTVSWHAAPSSVSDPLTSPPASLLWRYCVIGIHCPSSGELACVSLHGEPHCIGW